MKIVVITLIRDFNDEQNMPAYPFLRELERCEKHHFDTQLVGTSEVIKARNAACDKYLESDYDYVWMWDSDQKFDVESACKMVDRMVENDIHILSPCVPRNGRQDLVSAGKWLDGAGIKHLRMSQEGGLTEVDVCGEGGIMISLEALRATKDTEWFHQYEYKYNGRTMYTSGDYGFCLFMKERGYQTYVDLSLKAEHVQRNKQLNKRSQKMPEEKQQGQTIPKNLLEPFDGINRLYVSLYNEASKLQEENTRLKKEIVDRNKEIEELKKTSKVKAKKK